MKKKLKKTSNWILLVALLMMVRRSESASASACQNNNAYLSCSTKIQVQSASYVNSCGFWFYTCSSTTATSIVANECDGLSSCSYRADDGTSCKDIRITYECAVHGGWSNWGSWSSCSLTCGTGSQSRSRSCNNPSAQYGGDSCSGSSSQSQSCNTHSCPIDGGWTNWSSWGSCTVTCGGGTKDRSRSCTNPSPQHGGASCSGSTSDSTSCNTHNCPVDGAWAAWQSWQGCSVTCGEGIRYRSRTCTNPPPQFGGGGCPDSDTDSIACNKHYCRSTTLTNCGSPTQGLLMYDSVTSLTASLDGNNQFMYFLTGRAYDIDCCGLIASWEFYPKATGTIDLIVWSLDSGTTYRIKSLIQRTITGPIFRTPRSVYSNPMFPQMGPGSDINALYSYSVPTDSRTAIVDTDRVGWRASSSDMIPYTTCDDHNTYWCPEVYYFQTTGLIEGDTHNWGANSYHTTRGYAFNVYSASNTPISLNVSLFSEIPDNTPKGTSLWSYEITGLDYGEVAVFDWSGDHIYFNQSVSSKEIYILKDFEPATIDDSYQATMETEDSCSTSTATFSISVVNTFFGCEEKGEIMYKEPDLLTDTNDTGSGTMFMLYDDVYDNKCCGLVNGWEFYPTKAGTIEFIVFKHSSGDTFEIKAFNSYTVTAAEVSASQTVYFNVTEAESITIENGDRIGWRTSGDSIIPYAACDSSTDSDCPIVNLKKSSSGTLSEGDSVTWTSGSGGVTTAANIAYAIKADLGNNSVLSFERDTYYTKRSYDISVNTVLMTYLLNGIDFKDEVTWTFSDTYLKQDTTNNQIKLKTAFARVTSQNTYSADLVAVDLCMYTATATLSVDTYRMFDDCGYVPLLGADDPSIYNSSVDSGQANMYMMMDDMYIVPCCGVISAWEFFPKAVGFLEFMVWELKSGTTYKLKGFNRLEITADDVAAGVSVNYTVPSDSRIALEENDRMGWRAAGNTIVAHAACDIKTKAFCPTKNLKGVFTGTVADDIEYDWSNSTNADVVYVTDIGYAVRAHSADNLKIVFSEPEGYYAAVANHMPIGTSLTDYVVENVDYKEIVTLSFFHYYMELNESYSFVQLKNTFNAIAFVETHSATLSASGSCDHTTSVVVTIDAYNAPPIIRNLPRDIEIFEDAGPNEDLYFVDAFDPTNPPDPVCCRVEYVQPQTLNFKMILVNSTDFHITTAEKPIFSYDSINSYLVYVCCEDGYGTNRNYLRVGIKERPIIELYVPPGWFYVSIAASMVPICIMMLLSCALLFHSMFCVDTRDS